MFKWFSKHENRIETSSHNPASSGEAAVRRELAMRASIANKLKNYNAAEDTTISRFKLADEKPQRNQHIKAVRVSPRDAWGQADPRESGHWNRENRQARNKATA